MNNLYHGFGKLFIEYNRTYEGLFYRGKKDGYGILNIQENDYRYCGYWRNDYKNGNGFEEVKDKYIYQGEFKNDLKSGKGKKNI
jgi:radial spoke head protein 1